jgi:hypothetical protein
LVKDLGVPIGREGRESRICERGGSSGERRKGRMRRWRIHLAQSPSLSPRRLPKQPRHPRTEIEKPTLNISSSPRSYYTNGHCKSSWGNPRQRLFDHRKDDPFCFSVVARQRTARQSQEVPNGSSRSGWWRNWSRWLGESVNEPGGFGGSEHRSIHRVKRTETFFERH